MKPGISRHRWLNRAVFISLLLAAGASARAGEAPADRWPEAKAWAWQHQTGWLVGCNFLPSTAINQLEMFQADTFDLPTIDRELGWAESLGFNSVRVFLHNLLWDQDPQGFLERLDQFLTVAGKHRIGVVFVLFDSCWDPFPALGRQRAPKPHVHNSGWVQSPGAGVLLDPAKQPALAGYVRGVVGHLKGDRRVQAWDVWNEPDNMNQPAYIEHEPTNKVQLALPLLRQAFGWAREANPTQPLTSGLWVGDWPDPDRLSPTEQLQLSQSDVISFHNYGGLGDLTHAVEHLRRYHRPVLCTEYMSRGNGSFFDPNLGYLKWCGVGAYNWGLVAGKSQTIYPWDSWTKQYEREPALWFHDIFRPEGQPYRPTEATYIRGVTGNEVLFNGADLTGWRQPLGTWQVAGAVGLEPANSEAFRITDGLGLMVNGTAGRTVDLLTTAEFGDVELHVEFCIPRHSNSGVYLQGRYEVQVYDSYGVAKDAYPGIECGGIYPRWINGQNLDGHSPRVNASKPPGEWQSFDITFRAPRFDPQGRKVANARLVRVVHNGELVQANVELAGPTRAAHWADEAPTGPLLLQGDHGPVAYRHLWVKTPPAAE